MEHCFREMNLRMGAGSTLRLVIGLVLCSNLGKFILSSLIKLFLNLKELYARVLVRLILDNSHIVPS